MSLPAEFNYQAWWSEKLQAFECVGAAPTDIEGLARDQGVAGLPAAYEGFLKVAGFGCGRLWEGTDAFFPELIGLRDESKELLEEGDLGDLLEATDVVIAMHQGYEFLYLSGEAEDPAVFRFTEGGAGAIQVAERFTELILASLIESGPR
jgi:hypothetical protein